MARNKLGVIPPDLEQGKPEAHNTSEKKVTAGNEPRATETEDSKPESQSDTPFASHCRSDAPIWARYLEESETEDKEITDIWNSNLDSLLVFAGLFAAILTAFLIESSKDLKEDPQEHLLKQILNTMRNVSEVVSFEPEQSSLHVNGLWYTSLTLTLISALGGVLAKGWLAKYNPASNQVHAGHACERHLRANRAREWRLAQLISGIPLLIQISLFLFFAGLIIQLSDSDVRIWSTIVLFVAAITLLYVVGTILPWFSPACPFYTPISNFLPGVAARGQYKDGPMGSQEPIQQHILWKDRVASALNDIRQFLEEVHKRPGKDVMQSQILSWIVTNSANEAAIEEAIKAVAGSQQTKELRHALLQAGARETLHRRLKNCVRVTSGLPKTFINATQLEPLLYALLQIEKPLKGDAQNVNYLPYSPLLNAGQCLRRWNDFEPHLQVLVFSLRVHMLVNCDRDDHDENWDQLANDLRQMASTILPPPIRDLLFSATLRGLLKGRYVLGKTCAHILFKQLSNANIRKKLCTPGSLISGYNDESSDSIILGQLSRRIGQLCGDDDVHTSTVCMGILTKCAEYGNLRRLVAMALPEFATAFRSKHYWASKFAFTQFFLLDKPPEALLPRQEKRGFEFPEYDILFYDDPWSRRLAVIDTISTLSGHVELREPIRPFISCIFELLNGADQMVRSHVITTLTKMAGNAEFTETIRHLVPVLVELIKDDNTTVQNIARTTLTQLATNAQLHEEILPVLPNSLELLKYTNNSLQEAGVALFSEMAKHPGHREAILSTISAMTELLKDSNFNVRSSAASAICALAEHVEYWQDLRPHIPALVELLKDEMGPTRTAAVSAITKLAEYVGLHEGIIPIIPSVVELVNHANPQVRCNAVSILYAFAQHVELREVVCPSISSIAQLREDHDPKVRAEAITSVAKLAKHIQFRESTFPFVPLLILQLKGLDHTARSTVILALSDLVENVEVREAMSPVIPYLIDSLQAEDWDAESTALSSLAKLAKYKDFQDVIEQNVPFILSILAKKTSSQQFPIFSVIFNLPQSTRLRTALSASILSSCLLDPTRTTNDTSIPDLAPNFPTELQAHRPPRSALSSRFILYKSEQSSFSQLQSLLSDKRIYESQRGIESLRLLAQTFRDFPQPVAGAIEKMIKNARYNCLPQFPDLAKHDNLKTAVSMIEFSELLIDRFGYGLENRIRVFVKLAEHLELNAAACQFIPSVLELFTDSRPFVASEAVSSVRILAEHFKIYEAVFPAIPLLVELVKHSEFTLQDKIISTLIKLAKHTQLGAAFRPVIPLVVELLKDHNISIRFSTMSLLAELAKNGHHNEILAAIKLLVDLLIDEEWSYVSSQALFTLARLAKYFDLRKEINHFMPTIIGLLKDVDDDARGLVQFSLVDLVKEFESGESTGPTFPMLANLLKDANNGVRLQVISVLSQLATHTKLHQEISSIVPLLLELLKHVESTVRSSAASALVELAEHMEIAGSTYPVIPALFELLKDVDQETRRTAISAFTKLAKQDQLRKTIRTLIPSLVELINHEDGGVQAAALAVLLELGDHDDLRDTIYPGIPPPVTLLKHAAPEVRLAAISAMSSLAKHAELREAVRPGIHPLVGLLKDGDQSIRSAAAGSLKEAAKNVELREAIYPNIPLLVELCKHVDPDILIIAVSTCVDMANYAELRVEIRPIVSLLVEMHRNESEPVRQEATSALGNLADHIEFREIIRPIVPLLIDQLKDASLDVQSATVSTLVKLADHMEFHLEISPSLPSLVEFRISKGWDVRYSLPSLDGSHEGESQAANSSISSSVASESSKDEDLTVRSEIGSILVKWSENVELHGAISIAIPSLIKSLHDELWYSPPVPFCILLKLAENVDLCRPIRPVFRTLVQLLEEGNLSIDGQVAALVKLAEHAELRKETDLVVSLLELLRHAKSKVQSAAVSALKGLAQYAELREPMRLAVPSLIEHLKDNKPGIRISAGKTLEALLSYEDTRDAIFHVRPPNSWLEYLQDTKVAALGVFTGICCFLIGEGYIDTGVVQAILDAQNSLDDPSYSVRECGAAILLAMGTHARLRDILSEVCSIHAGIERYIVGTTRRDADMILQRMEYFGVLTTL